MGRGALVILELLSTDRYSQYRNESFPFLRALAARRGLSVHWFSLGFAPEAMPGGRHVVSLAPGDESRLASRLAALRPDQVLHNERLDAALAARLREISPRTRWLFVGHHTQIKPSATVGAIDAALGFAEAGAVAEETTLLAEAVVPDWRSECLNELAREIRPFIAVESGPNCLFKAPLARNPFYAEVDLSRATHDDACAFCSMVSDRRYPYQTRPEELAVRQIQAAQRTVPAERDSGVFLVGGAVCGRLRQFFDALLAAELAPCEIQLSFRLDELRRKARDLDRALPRLIAAGHKLAVFNMGVENFSPSENLRLNKRITHEDVAVAVAHLNRWEREYPGRFRFWELGGLGAILFTPWTTFADLRLNLDAAGELDIPAQSFFFVSRVQLLPDRPLTLLAEREGRIVSDPALSDVLSFDSGCLTDAEQRELSWRFQDRGVALVYGLAVRLRQAVHPGERLVPSEDPALPVVGRLVMALPPERRSLSWLMRCAMDLLERAGEVGSVHELAERLRSHELVRPVLEDFARQRARWRAFRDRVEAALVEPGDALPGDFRVFSVRLAPDAVNPTVRVVLRGAGGDLVLQVLPRGAGSPLSLLRAGRFALSWEDDVSAVGLSKREILRAVRWRLKGGRPRPTGGVNPSPLSPRTLALVSRLGAHPRQPLGPYRVSGAELVADGALFTLADGPRELRLRLAPVDPSRPAALQEGVWALVADEATPLETEAQRRVAALLLRFIASSQPS